MFVLVRLYPKGSVSDLWNTLEFEKRNHYWKDVNPFYAIQLEGKKYISIAMDVKTLDSIQDFFVKIGTKATLRKTKTIPIMSPLYFPLPDGHPKNLNRYLVFLKVKPEKYPFVTTAIKEMKYPKDVIVTFLSYSFGDDDIIISILAKDRETALHFVGDRFSKLEGVESSNMSRIMKDSLFVSKDRIKAYRKKFLYSQPVGQKGGKLANPQAYEEYRSERSPMTVIVRLFAKKTLAKLWEDIEVNIHNFETRELKVLYASQQEAKDYISVIFEALNFEVLKDFLVDNLSTMVDARKTMTVPMVEPKYYLLPKEHPKDLERYLISMKALPSHYKTIRSDIIRYEYPDNVLLTYQAYLMSDTDLVLSVLTDSRKSAQAMAKDLLGDLQGVRTYGLSAQLKTKRLATINSWKQHQGKFLASYDKQYGQDFNDYDWTDDQYMVMSGKQLKNLE